MTEKHYSPWVRARQDQLEKSVQSAWQLRLDRSEAQACSQDRSFDSRGCKSIDSSGSLSVALDRNAGRKIDAGILRYRDMPQSGTCIFGESVVSSK